MTPPTDPRPMTAAEARALDALVEWKRASREWCYATNAPHAMREAVRNAREVACLEFDAATRALVAEREVQRG